jgi:hypothetical protein
VTPTIIYTHTHTYTEIFILCKIQAINSSAYVVSMVVEKEHTDNKLF